MGSVSQKLFTDCKLSSGVDISSYLVAEDTTSIPGRSLFYLDNNFTFQKEQSQETWISEWMQLSWILDKNGTLIGHNKKMSL